MSRKYQGSLRSEAAIAGILRRRREARRGNRPDNRRRVFVGPFYVGMAPTEEHAVVLNTRAKEEFDGR